MIDSASSGRKKTSAKVAIVAGLIIIISWLCVLSITFRNAHSVERPPDLFQLVDECTRHHASLVKTALENLQFLDVEQVNCINFVRSEFLLLDFNIRRSEFGQQQFRGEVLLWIVVIITLSGVGLAALQLYVAFRLALAGHTELAQAALGQNNEATLTKDSLSVKSSVTGLLILALSLGFFVVYVKWVYPVTELKQEGSDYDHSLSAGPQGLLPAASQIHAAGTISESPQNKPPGPTDSSHAVQINNSSPAQSSTPPVASPMASAPQTP